MPTYDYYIIGCIAFAALLAFLWKKLDLAGSIAGFVVAALIYLGIGVSLLVLLTLFFVVGSLASKWKIKEKQKLALAQENSGRRGIANVIANGGVAALCAIFHLLTKEYHAIFTIMAATSLASACADTLASELGNIYGKRYVNIITLKKEKRGVDGAISLEGTLASIFGSFLIASAFYYYYHNLKAVTLIFLGGILGALIDSVLGATLQQRSILNNHSVNFFSALITSVLVGRYLYLQI